MARIAGFELPANKRIDIALTRIYGVGRQNVIEILSKAKIDPSKRTKTLSEEEIRKIQESISSYKVGGDLRKEVQESIKRLKEIGSYRGLRHTKGLPVRGQRTRSNARTKRGKRVTIGAMRKGVRARLERQSTVKRKEEKK